MKGIIFSKDSILAMLDDRKTETRRIRCRFKRGEILYVKEGFDITGYNNSEKTVDGFYAADGSVFNAVPLAEDEWEKFKNWREKIGYKSSLFMFKSLRRLKIVIDSINKEKLHDITGKACLREGIRIPVVDNKFVIRTVGKFAPVKYLPDNLGGEKVTAAILKAEYASVWDKLNNKRGYGWFANPDVYVIRFVVYRHGEVYNKYFDYQ